MELPTNHHQIKKNFSSLTPVILFLHLWSKIEVNAIYEAFDNNNDLPNKAKVACKASFPWRNVIQLVMKKFH